MLIRLGANHVNLQSPDPTISASWKRIFGRWLDSSAVPPEKPPLSLILKLVPNLPPPPAQAPHFRHPEGVLDLYLETPDQATMLFPGNALMTVPLLREPDHIGGFITEKGLSRQHLEDVTFTCLAPWLRRRNCYLLHAAALAKNNSAILLVGPSGSGKTTTALNLALAGWHLLANDVVLLSRSGEHIDAFATPGDVRIRPGTLELLSRLDPITPLLEGDGTNQLVARQDALAVSPGAHARVQRIYFPHVEKDSPSGKQAENRAVAFARLTEQSVDRWDSGLLDEHLDFLRDLSEQATSFRLILGKNATHVPALLAA